MGWHPGIQCDKCKKVRRLCFFFSSRRRHTRLQGDWSSDVCSSDLPQYDGELTIGGLSAPVTVYRDAHAIPQLYARTADDLFTAQGYVHAQERFWEMDFRRHLTSGRLAELFGAGQVDTDRYLRTMGWRHVAEREWDLISAENRR